MLVFGTQLDQYMCISMNVLSFLPVLEPSTSEVCSVESFRAALGTSCTNAIAVTNVIGKSVTVVQLHLKHIESEEIE